MTDIKNRTAAEVRSAFTRFSGNLGETGSVSFMFDRVGIIQFPVEVASNDQIFESAIEAGATDVDSDESYHTIYTEVDCFANCLEFLTAKYGIFEESYLGWKSQNTIVIEDKEKAEKILKLIDLLEESDDVQKVFGNYELSDKIYEQISN